MKYSLTCLTMAWALLATVGTSQAALTAIYSTDFKTTTYSDGGLIGQDGWLITGSSVTNPIVVSNSATTGTVALTNTGQDVNRPFGSSYSASNATSVYVMANISITAASATGDYFIHLGDGGTSNFYARTYAKTSNTGFALAMGTSSGTAVTYGNELSFGTYVILLRYDFVPGAGNDTGALFINPTTSDGIGDPVYVNATTVGADAASISSINLRQGSTSPTVVVDSLAVSFQVPETSTVALLGLSCMGLARRRR